MRLAGTEDPGSRGTTRRIALAATAMTLAVPGVASAHTELLGTTPPAGARVEEAPPALVVRYSAPLGAIRGATVTIDGEDVAGPPRLARRDAARVVIPLSAAGRSGRLDATWEVVSADGHALIGKTSFSIRAPGLQGSVDQVAGLLLRAATRLRAAV